MVCVLQQCRQSSFHRSILHCAAQCCGIDLNYSWLPISSWTATVNTVLPFGQLEEMVNDDVTVHTEDVFVMKEKKIRCGIRTVRTVVYFPFFIQKKSN
jgi:mannose-1-phosphate guanylyltransferase